MAELAMAEVTQAVAEVDRVDRKHLLGLVVLHGLQHLPFMNKNGEPTFVWRAADSHWAMGPARDEYYMDRYMSLLIAHRSRMRCIFEAWKVQQVFLTRIGQNRCWFTPLPLDQLFEPRRRFSEAEMRIVLLHSTADDDWLEWSFYNEFCAQHKWGITYAAAPRGAYVSYKDMMRGCQPCLGTQNTSEVPCFRVADSSNLLEAQPYTDQDWLNEAPHTPAHVALIKHLTRQEVLQLRYPILTLNDVV
jgi:hypothetical protein